MSARLSDVLIHLEAAIVALSNEAYEINTATGAETRLPAIESCIGNDLIQIDRRIGAQRPTLIGAIGESVREALAEIVAAQKILSTMKEGSHGAYRQKLPSGRADPDRLPAARLGCGDSSVLDALGLRLDISAARLACAKAKSPKTTADMACYLQRLADHKDLRAEYRNALFGLTGEPSEAIQRRLAL